MGRGGTVAAYGAAIVAFGYAAVSLYWAAGGRALLSTVGGYAQHAAQHGGGAAVVLGLAAVAVKVVGGLLALALVRPWGRVIPRLWLLIVSAAVSAVLVVYGVVIVLAGLLVLSGAYHPSGHVDRTALRWHAGVWDLWFLVWGVLLTVATISYWRASRGRSGTRPARSR